MSMTKRQAYAFDHPLNAVDDPLAIGAYRAQRQHASGLLLMSILAVDR